jgi:hypothetical protein
MLVRVGEWTAKRKTPSSIQVVAHHAPLFAFFAAFFPPSATSAKSIRRFPRIVSADVSCLVADQAMQVSGHELMPP